VITEDSAVVNEANPPSWGLDRLDGSMDNNYEYSLTGKGVELYVLDTGVNAYHQEFIGRVSCGTSVVSRENNCIDYRGHGSHVMGTAGGSQVGVCPYYKARCIILLPEKCIYLLQFFSCYRFTVRCRKGGHIDIGEGTRCRW